MEGLAYVDLGPDNGAILIDLAEGGLGFHSVAPVSLEQSVLVKFKLPKASGLIEGYAEVAWLDESGKGGGLRFVELKPEQREQIGVWAGTVAAEAEATGVEAGSNLAEAENASVKSESIVEPELVQAPADLATQPASEEAAAAISADVANADRGANAIQRIQTENALPSAKPSEEQAIAAAKPATPGGEPAVGKPSKPASNAAGKTYPPAGVPSDGISSRVHSGIVAASASETSVPASPIALSADSAAAGGGPRVKQMPPSPAVNSVSSQSQDRGTAPPAAVSNDEGTQRISLQSQVPARKREMWEAQGKEPIPNVEENPASQALKIGIGAAAGAVLVLAIVAGVPSLRTRVLATTNAKSAATPLESGIREFQVEVADVNNRRWILKSGGVAGSPFVDTSSRRNAQPAAAPARKNAAQPEGPSEADAAIAEPAPEIKQPKTASPAELVLARPLKGAPVGSQAQNVPPSIFDGITPPIGSLAENLPVTGPNVPGPAPVQPGTPGGNLQAAVLVKRVAPVYPSAAIKDGVRGEVRVKATIGKDGVPTNLTAVSGDPRLVQAALDAIRQWRYRPATLEGQAIETTTTVTVAFQAN